MVGWGSSRLNLNKPFSGPVSTLMSSSAEFYSSSLSGRLRAVGLNALTRLSTVIYMICAIKSPCLDVAVRLQEKVRPKHLDFCINMSAFKTQMREDRLSVATNVTTLANASRISKRWNVHCIWQFYLKSAAHKLCSTKLNSNKNAKSHLLLITSRRLYMWSTEGVTWHFYYYLVSYCTTCVQHSSDKTAKCIYICLDLWKPCL